MPNSNKKNPFGNEFKLRAKKLELDLESASLVEHSGLKGARIESVFADFLKSILPKKYSISTNQIIVDCEGRASKECDVVIYDASSSFRYLERFIPVELVYGVIEVKKTLDSKEAKNFVDKASSIWELNYRGYYTVDVENRLKDEKFHFSPPSFNLFSTSCHFKEFERFCAHVSTDCHGNNAWKNENDYSTSMKYFMSLCCSLDIGIFHNNLSNSFLAIDPSESTGIIRSADGKSYHVSKTASLLMFLTFLETRLEERILVTPYDHRGYSIFHGDISSGIEPDMKRYANYLEKVQSSRQ